jgi:hypothetical protein
MNSNLIPFVLLSILLFLAIREILTWYWKLNKISSLLEKIEENTRPKNPVKTNTEGNSTVK